jgi:RNA polymerase sigma-70 factor (ECF subfamily)
VSSKTVTPMAPNAWILCDNCLKRLPSQQRRLVERCYSGEETIKSVAENDGRSVHVVYKILRRMREILHDCVTRTVAAGAET